MKTAKFFHQQMDTGWTPFCVECQNPYVCPPLWRGMSPCLPPPQIKREKAIKRKEALELAKKEEEDTRLAEVFN